MTPSTIDRCESAPKAPDIKSRESRAPVVRVQLLQATEIGPYEKAWWKLASASVVANAFYEPWMILPAIQQLGSTENLRFLLVFGPANKDGIEPLWGFFPLEIQSRCLHLPIRTLAFWQHRFCFLAVPLIDAGHAREAFDAFWRWFEHNPLGCRILDTNYLVAEGPFHALWSDFIIGRTLHVLSEYPRALQVMEGTFDSYASGVISLKRRNACSRYERRLRELGTLSYRRVEAASEVEVWSSEFLRLEGSGWKGVTGGGAMANRNDDSMFFKEMLRAGFAEGRIWLTSLFLDERPIAMRVSLLTGAEGFIFKIAYDEAYAKYSPGMLLEIDALRRAFESGRVNEIDTCTSPRHSLFNLLANERRLIRRMLLSDRSSLGDFFVSAIPMVRWMKRQFMPDGGPSYFRISTKEKPLGA